ncbi:DUF6986 family protein [Streptomyces carpaticus]|uniref:Aldolase n=1 Tax=Streptomyces carpaticus TaxID=285558 RepID=A0ABV4ZIB0_9ACTN
MDQHRARTSIPATTRHEIAASLAGADAHLARHYPGENATRQPVHTVYVPADRFTPGTAPAWGAAALALLDTHAPDPAAFATALGLPAGLAEEIHHRVRAKLTREPVEDLRIDFEDGYGLRPDSEEDAAVLRAAAHLTTARRQGTAPPGVGIRCKSLEAPVRDRAIRTLDLFLTALLDAGPLPAPLRLTLPKVSHPDQVTAMARLCDAFETATGLPAGRLTFELQIETTQAIVGSDGRATVARLIAAAPTRVEALHYGTFDYSAACSVAAALQAPDHPAADHAKAVMQAAAAGTGVRLSDGSTNLLPTGDTAQVHHAWRHHHALVARSLARAYHQGWDMHPGQLPTRYAAVYAFYRQGLPDAARRLAAHLGGGPGNTTVLDEPATVRALAGFLLRGLHCGALDPREITAATGADPDTLHTLATPPH